MFIQDQRDVGEEHEEILCKRVVIRGTPVGSNSGNSQSQLTPLCFGCGLPVQERFYLVAAEQSWHIECLKCSVCDIKLETEITCFAKDGEIYCKDDYHRKFSKRCARCNRVLTAKELVMRAKDLIYHLTCFNCIICGVSLNPGEYFGLSTNGYIYCRSHYEPLLYTSLSTENDPNPLKSEESSPSRSLSSAELKTPKGRPKKRKNLGIHGNSHELGHNSCLMIPSDDTGLHLSSAQQTRNKRMRTSFKHHQLRTMKAYFGLNHNPDAKDLKQLAQKTGLTKRVLQVWFQNARAKYRRSVQCKPGCTPDINTKETSITGEQMKEIPGRNDQLGDECEKGAEDSQDRQDLVSSSSEVSPNTMDICYSPAFGSLSDDETASKSLADYFQSCDST